MSALSKAVVRFLKKYSERLEIRQRFHFAAKITYCAYKISEEEIEILLKSASLEIKAKKYSLAIPLLQQYLIHDPNSLKAMLLLGIAYRQIGNYEEAIKVHLKSLEQDEDQVRAHYSLGIDYEKKGNSETAKRYYTKTIELDKAFTKAYFRLANLYMNEEKYDLAVSLYIDGLSLREGSVNEWINLAYCYMKTAKHKAALKVLNEALKLNPTSSEVIFAFGTCYLSQHQYELVEEMIEKLDSEKDREFFLSLKIKVALDKHQYEELKELLDVIRRKERGEDYWYYKAIYYANTGKEKKAIKELEKATRVNSEMKNEAKKEEQFAKIREKEEFKEIIK